MNKIIIALLALLGLVPTITMPVKDVDIYGSMVDKYAKKASEKSFKAAKDFFWTVELKNKEKKPLFIQIYQEGEPILNVSENDVKIEASKGSKESEHGYLRLAGINPTKEIRMYLWKKYDENKIQNDQQPDDSITIVPNKNREIILLTYEKAKWRAQKGKYAGKIGSTSQSGLSTENNVTDKEVKSGVATSKSK